jgi:hypothetical protein
MQEQASFFYQEDLRFYDISYKTGQAKLPQHLQLTNSVEHNPS